MIPRPNRVAYKGKIAAFSRRRTIDGCRALNHNGVATPSSPRAARSIARSVAVEMKARQAAKFETEGCSGRRRFGSRSTSPVRWASLRSTTWAILQANHKGSGLSGAIIKRMLLEPRLPDAARVKILEYVQEKTAGHYGHSRKRLRIFVAQFFARRGIAAECEFGPGPVAHRT